MTADEPGWTLETLHAHLLSLMDERDRRYEQRAVAQERAVDLALQRVDKEFHEHLEQVKIENRLALANQDKALSKQEQATDRRFESINEFRTSLADQARNFLPRNEYDRSLGGLAKRLDDLHNSILERIEASGKSCTAQIEALEVRVVSIEALR